MIDEKGYSVDSIVGCSQWLGYAKVMLKTNAAPAIVKILGVSWRDLRMQGREQDMSENPPDLSHRPSATRS